MEEIKPSWCLNFRPASTTPNGSARRLVALKSSKRSVTAVVPGPSPRPHTLKTSHCGLAPARITCPPQQSIQAQNILFGFALPRGFTGEDAMKESQQLLAEYALNGSEAAFRELVAR